MAMTKRLWSINALAVELERDRRTVALALRDVRPDGEIKGNPAWFIETALRALKFTEKRPRHDKPLATRGVMADVFLGRVDDWREIYLERTPEERIAAQGLDIGKVAESFQVEPADVLVWLRAGCPYRVEGNWETGEGFVLAFHWVAEWTTLVFGYLALDQDREAMKILRMQRWER